MLTYKTHLTRRALISIAAVTITTGALAQTSWPERAVKLVVPYAAGGATDTLARAIAPRLSEKLGQPVVVENKPGAGTALAASALARNAPDGYNIMLGGSATLTFNPALKGNLQYDPVKSFTPLANVADVPLILVTNADSEINSFADLVKMAKASPGKISYGSFGMGSSAHFGGEMIKGAAGIDITHIPFNGSSPSLTALLGGQINLAVDTVSASLPFVQSNKVRVLATLTGKRLNVLPNTPTVAESGYPGFELNTWFGMLAPAGLPPAIREKLESHLAHALQSPDIKEKMTSMGLTPVYGNGAFLQARVERELPVIRATAVRAKIEVE